MAGVLRFIKLGFASLNGYNSVLGQSYYILRIYEPIIFQLQNYILHQSNTNWNGCFYAII